MNLLLVGPLPPPIGGTTVLFNQLLDDLSGTANLSLRVINTGRRRATPVVNLAHACVCALQLAICIPRATVVSLHASPGGAARFGMVAYALCWLTGKPLVTRIFGGNLHYWHANASQLTRRIFDLTVMRSAQVLVESKAAVAYFHERGFPSVTWYPNSRHAVQPPSTSFSLATTTPRFVFLGHVSPAKGIKELIDAAALVGQSDLQVDVYGPLKPGISERTFENTPVRYLGEISHERVPAILRQYDVLVLPSLRSEEGYPGVILEAYLSGLAVIAARIGGIPEIVTEQTGLLVDPGDSAQLAKAMRTVIDSPRLLTTMRNAALAASKEFEAERWSSEFLNICKRLL